MTILYISLNGVTDHIGRSQIAPYMLGLARRGFKIHIVTAEKRGNEELVRRYGRVFAEAGVSWTHVAYVGEPPLVGQAITLLRMWRAARRVARAEPVRLTHCRCFPASLIGWSLKRTFQIRFLYDFRDFFIDDMLAKTRGPRRALVRLFKQLEGPMIRAADKIVCLTERAVHILSSRYLKHDLQAKARFQIVPCCADFSHFDPNRVSAADIANAREKTRLREGDFVLLYLGSLGPDYLLAPMIALFAQLLEMRPNARFLFLSNNGEELVESACAKFGIQPEYVSFVTADRDEVPTFLSLADMAVIFIRADLSKAGCSPTKLAELFACGVPIIANAGVGDMDQILDPETNGSVLVTDFSDTAFRAAIAEALARKGTTNIRENSRMFDVAEGVSRYAAAYVQLMDQESEELAC